MSTTQQPVVVYTLDEVAAMLRVSKTFIRDQVRAGAVTPLRVGSRANAPMRFFPEDVEALLQAMTPDKAEPEPVAVQGRRRPHRLT